MFCFDRQFVENARAASPFLSSGSAQMRSAHSPVAKVRSYQRFKIVFHFHNPFIKKREIPKNLPKEVSCRLILTSHTSFTLQGFPSSGSIQRHMHICICIAPRISMILHTDFFIAAFPFRLDAFIILKWPFLVQYAILIGRYRLRLYLTAGMRLQIPGKL